MTKTDDLFELPQDVMSYAGMPDYDNKDKTPKYQILVSFKNEEDIKDFSKIIGQPLTTRTKAVWHPQAEIGKVIDKAYVLFEGLKEV
jgi:hypothetical protein